MNREEIKPFIAKRVAKELHDGDVVNLGIGLPTMVPAFLPENVHVTLHAENGIIHAGGHPGEEAEPAYVVDAGGKPASVQTGGAFIDSSVSFRSSAAGILTARCSARWRWMKRETFQTGLSRARSYREWVGQWTLSLVQRRSSLPWSILPKGARKF